MLSNRHHAASAPFKVIPHTTSKEWVQESLIKTMPKNLPDWTIKHLKNHEPICIDDVPIRELPYYLQTELDLCRNINLKVKHNNSM